MPISATGNRRDAGFSLVEALTVIFIVGLMAGAVVLLAPGPGRQTKAFAEQFAGRIALASDESVIANKPLALVVNENGYGFARLEPSGWRVIDHGSPLAFRPWPEAIAYRVEETALDPAQGRIARFDALGAATPASILIDGAGARWRVAIDAQGRAHVAPVE